MPWAPGPLVFVPAEAGRDDSDERPIWFNAVVAAIQCLWVVLYLVGLVVVGPLPAWLVLVAFPGLLNVVAWRVWRAWTDRRARSALAVRSRLLQQGIPLNPADPDVMDLITGFGRVLAASRLPGVGADAAVSAAHAALIEAASLLQGGVPAGPGDRAFVQRRVAAVAVLATAVRDLHERLDPSSLDLVAAVRRQLDIDLGRAG